MGDELGELMVEACVSGTLDVPPAAVAVTAIRELTPLTRCHEQAAQKVASGRTCMLSLSILRPLWSVADRMASAQRRGLLRWAQCCGERGMPMVESFACV